MGATELEMTRSLDYVAPNIFSDFGTFRAKGALNNLTDMIKGLKDH